MMKKLLLGFALTLSLSAAQAQAPVQQSPTELRACSSSNTKGATNATATVTIAPPNSQYVYLCGVDFQIVNTATGAVTQAQVCFTTTNLGGAQWCYSSANAANTSSSFGPFFPTFGVKSAAAGTAVTIVSPAANTQALYNINAYYYFAP